MILIIDNYDSFTYNLVQYIGAFNPDLIVHRNDAITLEIIKNLTPERIVISPGPGIPEEAGLSIDIVKEFRKSIPILGICRGAQLINIFFNGKISKAYGHMRSRHNIWFSNDEVIKTKVLNVNSFHDSTILRKNLAKKAKEIAFDSKKNVEMFYIKNNNIIGVMWHPEREKNNKILKRLLFFLTKKK